MILFIDAGSFYSWLMQLTPLAFHLSPAFRFHSQNLGKFMAEFMADKATRKNEIVLNEVDANGTMVKKRVNGLYALQPTILPHSWKKRM